MTATTPTYTNVMDVAGAKLDAALRSIAVEAEPEKPADPPKDDGAPTPDDGTTPEDKSAEPAPGDQGGTPAKVEATDGGKVEEPKSDDAELTPEQILAKYSSPEDRDKALVESQRFIAKLKAENAGLKQPKPAEPTPQPQPTAATTAPSAPADVRTWFNDIVTAKEPEKVQKLTPAERQIAGRFRELESERATMNEASKEITDMATKEGALETEIQKLETKLEAFKDVLKDDPEDYTAKQQVERLEKQLSEKSSELQRTTIKRMDKSQRLAMDSERHRAKIGALDQDVTRIHGSMSAEAKQRTDEENLYNEKNGEWKKALTTVLDVEGKDKYSQEERNLLAKLLQKDLADHLEDPKADYPADMASWVRSSPSLREFEAARRTSPSAVARAVDEVAPKAPKESSVPQGNPQGGKDKTTFRQALKTAESRFDKALRGVRV